MKQIPNLFTLLNLVFGCCAIVMTLQQGITIASDEDGSRWVMMPEAIWYASLFIGLAAVVDFLDGFVARLFKATSEMGKQLDSLADVVSFGVAPALIIYQFLRISVARQENGLDASILYFVPAFLFAAAAAWRLAKFNLATDQQYGFKGVPTPAAGLLVASFPLIYWYSGNETLISLFQNKWFWYGVTALISGLMVSNLPLLALKFKAGSVKNYLPQLILAVAAAGSALFLHWLAVPLVFILYIVVSLLFQKKDYMTYTVQVKVMPLKELLDPQGKAVMGGLGNLGLNAISDVRIGKHITLQVAAEDEAEAKGLAEEAAKKLLANPVMEYFEISVQ